MAVSTFRPAALPTTSHAPSPTDARARAAGYAAGWAAGARAAAEAGAELERRLEAHHERAEVERDAAVVDALAVLERAVGAAAARTVPVVTEVRRSVYQAALDLAAAVLQRELTPGPASAAALLERALQLPVDLGVHTVRLSPADLAAVQALLADGSAQLPAGVALVADPRLRPGDVISEHPAGLLDAQIGSALDRAREALLEDLR
ncbi:MAG TPA: FliH/SctL family protein [Actinotalea sp.]